MADEFDVDALRERIRELEHALKPFAAVITYTTAGMQEDAPIHISHVIRFDAEATGDTLPQAFTVGDVRRAYHAMRPADEPSAFCPPTKR
jgi:hypothetical protein